MGVMSAATPAGAAPRATVTLRPAVVELSHAAICTRWSTAPDGRWNWYHQLTGIGLVWNTPTPVAMLTEVSHCTEVPGGTTSLAPTTNTVSDVPPQGSGCGSSRIASPLVAKPRGLSAAGPGAAHATDKASVNHTLRSLNLICPLLGPSAEDPADRPLSASVSASR